MSVRVNLLPREVELRARERRVALGSLTALAVWVLLLALLFLQQVLSVGNARDVRDEEQAELVRLQARAEELAPYRELALRYDRRNEMLIASMSGQIAWSGALNDVALVFPPNSSLLTLSANAAVVMEGAVPDPAVAGRLQFNGYSVERYAPGVESVLLGLDDAAVFDALYLSSASRSEIGDNEVTTFIGSASLTGRAFTGRFVLGLPEDER